MDIRIVTATRRATASGTARIGLLAVAAFGFLRLIVLLGEVDIWIVVVFRFLGLGILRLFGGVRIFALFLCRGLSLSHTLVVSLLGAVDELVEVLGEGLEGCPIDRRGAGEVGRLEHEHNAVVIGVRLGSHFGRRRQTASAGTLDTLQIERFAFAVGRLQFREGRREAQRGYVRSVLGFL